jgi:3-dehydroquinate synthase
MSTKTINTNIQFINLCDPQLIAHLQSHNQHMIVITDDNIKPLYAKRLAHDIKAPIISIPAGEQYKNRQTKAQIEDQLLALGTNRYDLIIAIGGGVITDIAGFVAATYMRGIDHINIPTTLLAMVDAAIGGKTAINTPAAKNSIGAFKPAKEIIIDPSVLTTLTSAGMRDGLVETIKHGLIADSALFQLCEANINHILTGQFQDMPSLIKHSISIKDNIVTEDKLDHGIRHILNFGHTIGHSIEQHGEYTITHGTAVAIGMILEAEISHKLDYLNKNDYLRIKRCLLPLCIHEIETITADTKSLIDIMRLDKKNRSKDIRCVLLTKIGECARAGNTHSIAIAEHVLHDTIHEFLTNGISACLP